MGRGVAVVVALLLLVVVVVRAVVAVVVVGGGLREPIYHWLSCTYGPSWEWANPNSSTPHTIGGIDPFPKGGNDSFMSIRAVTVVQD